MAADGDKMERTVSVSATGSVTAEADIAQISAGVVTEGDSAKDAIGRNNVVMAKLIAGLKSFGYPGERHPDHDAQRRAALHAAQGWTRRDHQRLSRRQSGAPYGA